MKLKFCGLTREADIRAANETRPDYIGFVFAESRRRVTDEQVARLRALLSPGIQAVGVFVNDDPTHIALLANRGVIDLIQLHGSESAAYIQRLRTMTAAPIICALRVGKQTDIKQAESNLVDFLLLDTYTKDAYGGSGRTFDWSLIGEVGKPYFLAGGLNESNIPHAMRTGAYALDLSSGIETDGVKDAEKMRRVAALVKGGQP
ncbi:phosphoribosylanthranilate isomerase [Agathobaculum sp.]|uniref:phosphoribosylanthranilate isomerase n=1 Tax=Agathobaculum sp. TaxID=2048138 RepID=UPI0027BA9F25|nr:phosphoribosylanthranilate isomerase [Agathobaculum sp.]